MSNYWSGTLRKQISRRRALVATGAATMGAALLAACGGGSDGEGQSSGGLLSFPKDTTAQAKPGGVYKTTMSDPPSLDPIAAGFIPAMGITANYAYPRLLQFKVAKYPNSADGSLEGYVAETYELSPDKTTLTLKIRSGMPWDLRTPRDIDAEDVVYSWKKLTSQGSLRVNIDANSNPEAPVESVTAPDNRTVVIKMKPDPAALGLIASFQIFILMPRESDGGFDPRSEIRGYGPWNFVEWKPSQGMTYKKNPNYYKKGLPYFDSIELYNLPEYATRLAQFRAGVLWTNIANVNDVLPTKRELPETEIRLGDGYATHPGTVVTFGFEDKSPFNDMRVRQAFTLLVDRDASADVVTNSTKFQAEGIDVALRANTVIGPAWPQWLDPNGKDFGPNAKYYKADIAEAKRLLSAAGFPNGFDTEYMPGTATSELGDILVGQLSEGGIRAKYKLLGSAADISRFITQAYGSFNNNGFSGFTQRRIAEYADLGLTIANTALAGQRSFIGMTVDGTKPEQGDPDINDRIRKMRSEFDPKKLEEMAHEYQRVMAAKAYMVPITHASPGVTLNWPVVGNLGVYRGHPGAGAPATDVFPYYWMDETKAPIKKA